MPKLIILLFCFLCAHHTVAQNRNGEREQSRQFYLKDLKLLGKIFADNFYPNYATFYSLPEKEFVIKIDSVRCEFNSLLKKFESDLSPEFVNEQYLEIKFYFDKLLIDYPLNHEIYKGKVSNKYSVISERIKENLADFNRPELLNNKDFVDYVKSFFAYKLNAELKKPAYQNADNRQLKAVWKLILQFVSNSTCRQFWQAEYLYNHIDNNGIKNIQDIYANFRSSCNDTVLLNKVIHIYSEDFAGRQGHLVRTYKTVGAFELDMHIFLPDSLMKGKKPALIYFHGGSWSEGKPDWFFYACENIAKKGWIACAVEYRILSRHGTLPFEAVMDAKSAIRWLRQHADEFDIDTNKIVASGNSAGGHLVLCAALADKWNEKTDNMGVSSVPDLLMINSGVFDLSDRTTAWIRKDLKDKHMVEEISPTHLIHNNLPPTLMIHGTDDQNVPYLTAQQFFDNAKKTGCTTIEFYPLEKAGHFIWYNTKYREGVSKIRKEFLTRHGYPD